MTYKALCFPGREDRGPGTLGRGPLWPEVLSPLLGFLSPAGLCPPLKRVTETCSGVRPGLASEKSQPDYLNRVLKTSLQPYLILRSNLPP